MKFTDAQIDSLRREVGGRLSEKRFAHTLGVEKMAVKLGELCLPDMVDKLHVAALLHDISKEYSEAEHFFIAEKHNIVFSDAEINEPALWHSLTAAAVVMDEFPDYADRDVLTAVYNHTVGSPDMSIFDEIILLSDYIEEGRKYQNCIDVRERFFSDIQKSRNYNDRLLALHEATVDSFNNNINEFILRGKSFHERTLTTRDEILKKAERLKMKINKDLLNCDSGTLAREAVKVLIEKKAIDVKLFDVREKSSVTDYYINVTGRSSSNVASLADDVDTLLAQRGRAPLRTEGKRGNSWILVDFGDVIVNVFDRASRDFYSLDRHLPEDSQVDISDLVAEVDAKFDINKN
jgi:ribosome-associated protein